MRMVTIEPEGVFGPIHDRSPRWKHRIGWSGRLSSVIIWDVRSLLLVDLDDTLIDRAAGFARWAEEFLRTIGHRSKAEMAWLLSLDDDAMTPRSRLFAAVRVRYGLRPSIETLVAHYQAELPRLIPPPSEKTPGALRSAREAGHCVCIVTNGSRRTQEPKITPELAAAVDGWVVSEAVGTAKPDPALLLAAADCVGRRLAADSWLIGDRAETDVLGAARAGIRSAWIKRGRVWDSHLPYRPTIEAATVWEAIDRIL